MKNVLNIAAAAAVASTVVAATVEKLKSFIKLANDQRAGNKLWMVM